MIMVKIKQLNISKEEAHKIWNNWRRRNKEIYQKLLKQCCFCKKKQLLTIHHIDGNKTNNNLDNLQCLCRDCHFTLHKNFRISYSDTWITQQKKLIRVALKQEDVDLVAELNDEILIHNEINGTRYKRMWQL